MLLTVLLVVAALAVAVILADRLAPAAAARFALALERRLSGLRVERATSGNFAFAYQHTGNGETLLLVHGFGADKDNFTRVSRHLRRQFRVVAVDLPGFGDSERLMEGRYHVPDQSERLLQMADALGLERFHLGGSSMGGAIAIDFAARWPERVSSLWLLAPGGVRSAPDSEMIAGYRASGRSRLVIRHAGEFGDVLALTMHRRPFIPYSLKRSLGQRGETDSALHTRIFDELATSPPIEENAPRVQAPALIVWGREDRVLHPDGAAILHAAMPRSELVLMDGVGHLPMIEQPRVCARDFLAFCSRL